jgi:hypothetical protein
VTPADVPPGGTVSRRSLLAAAAALPILVTGCKGVQALGTPPPPGSEIVALRSAISAEKIMVSTYATMLGLLRSQLPSQPTSQDVRLEAAIRTVQADHAAHLQQLKSRLIEPAGSALALSPMPTPSASIALTGGVSAELVALEQAEQAASDRLLGQLAGLPPSLAQLFASIAASEATHVPYLQAAGRGR